MEKTKEEELCGMLNEGRCVAGQELERARQVIRELREEKTDRENAWAEETRALEQCEKDRVEGDKEIARLDGELEKAMGRVKELEEQRQEAQSTVNSIATMLGWGNVPPRETLERDLQALKERLHLAENERGTAESQVREAERVQKESIKDYAVILCLPKLDKGTEYGGGAILKGIVCFREALEFYGKLGNWQGMKDGFEESACVREMGARARFVMGRPDRVVEEDGE